MASLHTFLTKFPSQIENLDSLELLIEKAMILYKNNPVDLLPRLNEQWKEKSYVVNKQKIG